MTRSFKALILAGVATLGLGLMPALAAADDGRRGQGNGGRGQVQWSRGHDQDRGAGRHGKHEPLKAAAWHGNGHSYKYQAPKHGHAEPRRSRGHDDHDLLPFLVIGAIGVSAVILASQSHAEAPRAQTVAYVPPAPAPAYRPAPGYTWEPAPQGAAATCLMTREYQTQITVGGRLVDAYGQACLQPDGAWLKGPAQPVPY